MHPASMSLMLRLCTDRGLLDEPGKVLEVGSLDVNGSYRHLFRNPKRYTGIDHVKGAGVDLEADIHDDFAELLADGALPADLVISGQQLEHDPRPWLTVTAMVRAVWEVRGTVILVAPWRFPYHHPPDYWRFSPAGLGRLISWAIATQMAFGGRPEVAPDWESGWSLQHANGKLDLVSDGPGARWPADFQEVDSWAVLSFQEGRSA